MVAKWVIGTMIYQLLNNLSEKVDVTSAHAWGGHHCEGRVKEPFFQRLAIRRGNFVKEKLWA